MLGVSYLAVDHATGVVIQYNVKVTCFHCLKKKASRPGELCGQIPLLDLLP